MAGPLAPHGGSPALSLALLGLSVAANALGHGLAAFALAPAWWVVVVVSAIAPAVLGAVVHLAVLVGRPAETALPSGTDGQDPPDRAVALIAEGAGRRRLSRELDISEYEARRLLTRSRADATTRPAETGSTSTSTDIAAAPEWALSANGSRGSTS